MKPRFLYLLVWVWSIIGVPILHAAYIHLSYRYSLSRGYLPYTLLPEWLYSSIPLVFLLSGVIGIFKVSAKGQPRIVKIGAYALIMIGVMFFIWFEIACFNGDCL